NYAALMIDLKRSRSYSVEDRTSIQEYMLTVIQSLNKLFSKTLAMDVEFSAGDEVQGLFTFPEAAYLYFRLFCMLVFPVESRAGIGVGEWNVKIKNASTAAQDGPAYHNARYAIEQVKAVPGYSILFYTESETDLFLNAAANMFFALTGSHSEYQNELMLLLELLYPINCYHAIDCEKIKLLSTLITEKNKLHYYMEYKKSRSVKKYPFDKAEYMEFESIPINAAEDDSTFYVSGGMKRGMITKLSEALNISRQTIEKTVKTANIYEARNSVIVTLKFMDQYL
ncbi:MAG TPA: SatD family protein, partial [Lachnospiraceae bacterium]|nr:SatD family protein [Lachnospiraceae bacterium]